MVDPTTVNKLLAVPTRGSDSGTWDTPVNNDFTAIDGMLGGVVTKTVSNVNITLTSPSGSTTPGAGPTEAQNAVVRLSGTLTGSISVVLPLPGFYIIDNRATVGSSFIKLTCAIGGGLGEEIGAPPGQATQVFSDGSNVRFVGLPIIGSYLDLAAAAVPIWITNCTVPPYLNCDGSSFSAVTYPNLNALLGGTTLPDLRGRLRATLNQGTGRITTAQNANNPDGNTLLATGGVASVVLAQVNLPSYNLTVTDPGHSHTGAVSNNSANTNQPSGNYPGGGGTAPQVYNTTANASFKSDFISTVTTGITVSSGGSGASITGIPPAQIAGITLIRAG